MILLSEVIRQFVCDAIFFNVKSLSYVVQAIIEVSCYLLFFHHYNFVVEICRFISTEWFSKFPWTFRRWVSWDMLWEVLIVLIFLLRLTTKFLHVSYNFNISGLFEMIKGLCFPQITFVLRGICLFIFFRKIIFPFRETNFFV